MIVQKAGTAQLSFGKKLTRELALGLAFCLSLTFLSQPLWAQSAAPVTKKTETAKSVSSDSNDDWGFTFPPFFCQF